MRRKRLTRKALSTALAISMVASSVFLPSNLLTAYAANYVVQDGEIPEKATSLKALPTSLNCVVEGGAIQTPKNVDWEIAKGSFLDAGSKVSAVATIEENNQKVNASILAIPNDVVYLVDCNTTTETSKDFQRFKAEAYDSSNLQNDVPDQEYSVGGWGYINNGFGRKENVGGIYEETKNNTGYYGNNGQPIQYKLPLEEGTYTVAASLFEWWGGQNRETEVVVTFLNEENMSETKSLGSAHFTSSESNKVVEGSFTIPNDQEITLSFTKGGKGQHDAAVSGFTVIKTEEELPSEDKAIAFTVDGSIVDEANTFGGFGAVTCNNTSRLLLDYKEKNPDQYWEMLTLLFDKETGAGLHHIKIEMGADVNSSSGTEPATMRSPDEEANVKRGAGFHFAADAKTINPDITVEILRWGEPKWTQEGIGYEDYDNPKFEARYQWYRKTIDAVYDTYGYKINDVSPGQNERNNDHPDDFAWIKYCAQRFKEDAENGVGTYDYNEIKIVAADLYRGMNTTVSYLKDDPELRELVDVISDHYAVNLGSEDLTWLNQEEGIEVWYGEAIAPMINANYRVNVEPDKGGVGGTTSMADLAERFMAAYSYKSNSGHPSRMTNFLFQPAIGAFYEGSAYSPKQLIGAFDPWSGYYEADGGIQMVQHFMLFADNNWKYLPEACYSDGAIGDGGMVYNTSTDVHMTVKDPETDDYSIMFANNTVAEREYNITLKNLSTLNAEYNVWETAGPGTGQEYDAGWFQKVTEKAIPQDNGDGTATIRLIVKPHSIVTLTTLVERGTSYVSGSNTAKDTAGIALERTVLELPYRDDFDYSDGFVEERGGTPLYTTDLEGAFEVVKVKDADGYVLQQRINNDNRPYNWNPWGGGSDESSQTTGTPWTVMGDHRWANYVAGIDFKLDTQSNGYGDNFAVLGVRELVHSSGAAYRGRIYEDGKWELLRFGSVKKSGKIQDFNAGIWHKLQMKADEDTITMYLDGEELGSYTDNSSSPVMTGRVTMMSGFWNTCFDNLEVLPIEGKAETAVQKIDDTSPLLTFSNGVTHRVGEGFAYYNRTRTIMKQGDTLEFDVPAGQGFDVFGKSSSAKIKIEKNGEVLVNEAATFSSGDRETSYWNTDSMDAGNIKITVLSGTYDVDGVNLFDVAYTGFVELYREELEQMIIYAKALTWEDDDYPQALLEQLETAIADGEMAMSEALSQMEIDLAAMNIRNAIVQIVPGDTIVGIVDTINDIVTMEGEMPELPEQITILNAAGEQTKVDVVWDMTEEDFEQAWDMITVTGKIEGVSKSLTTSVQVVPWGLTHFINSGTVNVTNDEGDSGHTKVYDMIASSIELENEKSDQIYTDGTWGYVNDSINIKSADSVNYNTDIYTSGLYSGSGKDIIYKVPLKAGKYVITTGYQAYWNEQRTMDVWVKYLDEESMEQKKSLGSVTVNSSNNNIHHDGVIELPIDCEVEIHAGKNSGSKDPILSWLAISDGTIADYNKVVLNTDLPLTVEKGLSDIPESVNISYKGETKDVDVDWKLSSGDLKKTGSVVTLKGQLEGLDKKIIWMPVVYSENLVYMIDSGIMNAGGSPYSSEIYDEIAENVSLINEVPDQDADGNTWGYEGIDGSPNYQNGYGFHSTGFYGKNKNGESFTYRVMLDAGEYRVNTGHTEWWTQNRGTQVSVSYEQNGNQVEKTLGQAVWGAGNKWAEAKVSGDFTVLQDQTEVILTFTAISYNQGAVVSYIAIEEISATGDIQEIKVQTLPDKMVYQIGEELDTTGMIVVAIDSNGESRELNEDEYIVSDLDSSEEGKKEITVTVVAEDGTIFTDSFKVTVTEAEYYTTKIKVTKKPNKIIYDVDEEFDTTGMVVKAVMKASPSNAATYEQVIEDYEVDYDFSTPGKKDVGIVYRAENKDGNTEEFTTSVSVTVQEGIPVDEEHYTTKIKVTKQPKKTVYYVGEDFDPEGMVVKEYKKSVQSNKEVEQAIEDYELKVPSFESAGTKTIRISYEAQGRDGKLKTFEDSFKVVVIARKSGGSSSNRDSGIGMNGAWISDSGAWQFRKLNGGLAKNEWGLINGRWYHFDQDGWMQTGWLLDQNHWYYLRADGSMAEASWVEVNGVWYYLGTNGAMIANARTPDGYWVDETGAWIPGK